MSDLHVGYPENRVIVDQLRSDNPADWLVGAGDIAVTAADAGSVLGMLRERFHTVIWVPGNQELWTLPADPVTVRAVERTSRWWRWAGSSACSPQAPA